MNTGVINGYEENHLLKLANTIFLSSSNKNCFILLIFITNYVFFECLLFY